MPSSHMFINKIIETLVSKQIEDEFVQKKKKKTTEKSEPKKPLREQECCLLLPLDYALRYTVS